MPSYDNAKRLRRRLSILRRRGTLRRSSSWSRNARWLSVGWIFAVRGERLRRWARWWRLVHGRRSGTRGVDLWGESACNPAQGIEGVRVAKQADDDGPGHMSTVTQRLGTATKIVVDWMDYPSSVQIAPGLPPPFRRFPSNVWERFWWIYSLLTLLTPKCSTPINMQLTLPTMPPNQPMWPEMKCTASLLCCSCKHISIFTWPSIFTRTF